VDAEWIRREWAHRAWDPASWVVPGWVLTLRRIQKVTVCGILASVMISNASQGGRLFDPWPWVALATFGTLALIAVTAGLVAWRPLVRWQLLRGARAYDGSMPPPAGLVKVTGTIGAGRTFVSPVGGRPAVFVHVHATADPLRRDVRGIDFVLDVKYAPIRIVACDAHLTDETPVPAARPFDPELARRWGTAYSEAVLAPGDRVEAIGFLVHDIDPDAERDHPREAPRRLTLRGDRGVPVLLRRAP
jgi:hypothetical protein